MKQVFDMVRSISINKQLKVSRSLADFLSDRIVIAASEPTLLKFGERLAALMDSDLGRIPADIVSGFINFAHSSKSDNGLNWIRQQPRILGMLCLLKQDQYLEAIAELSIEEDTDYGAFDIIPRRPFDIPIELTLTTPLAHGADMKAGNNTLFRRMQVLGRNGQVLALPFYAGNAFRGQMRDCLADHFLTAVGKTPDRSKPPVSLWFFHSLYAGGALAEKSKETEAIVKYSGGQGIKADAIREMRETIPALSLLGFAFGNRILSGRVNVGDFRPRCKEWGSGDNHHHELMSWIYLTRREDHEGHEQGENSSMIANTEVLKTGCVLDGGVDVLDNASDLERSALALGIELMAKRGRIGAENRRDCGGIILKSDGAGDSGLYLKYLSDNKQKVIDFLNNVNAFAGNLINDELAIGSVPGEQTEIE